MNAHDFAPYGYADPVVLGGLTAARSDARLAAVRRRSLEAIIASSR